MTELNKIFYFLGWAKIKVGKQLGFYSQTPDVDYVELQCSDQILQQHYAFEKSCRLDPPYKPSKIFNTS